MYVINTSTISKGFHNLTASSDYYSFFKEKSNEIKEEIKQRKMLIYNYSFINTINNNSLNTFNSNFVNNIFRKIMLSRFVSNDKIDFYSIIDEKDVFFMCRIELYKQRKEIYLIVYKDLSFDFFIKLYLYEDREMYKNISENLKNYTYNEYMVNILLKINVKNNHDILQKYLEKTNPKIKNVLCNISTENLQYLILTILTIDETNSNKEYYFTKIKIDFGENDICIEDKIETFSKTVEISVFEKKLHLNSIVPEENLRKFIRFKDEKLVSPNKEHITVETDVYLDEYFKIDFQYFEEKISEDFIKIYYKPLVDTHYRDNSLWKDDKDYFTNNKDDQFIFYKYKNTVYSFEELCQIYCKEKGVDYELNKHLFLEDAPVDFNSDIPSSYLGDWRYDISDDKKLKPIFKYRPEKFITKKFLKPVLSRKEDLSIQKSLNINTNIGKLKLLLIDQNKLDSEKEHKLKLYISGQAAGINPILLYTRPTVLNSSFKDMRRITETMNNEDILKRTYWEELPLLGIDNKDILETKDLVDIYTDSNLIILFIKDKNKEFMGDAYVYGYIHDQMPISMNSPAINIKDFFEKHYFSFDTPNLDGNLITDTTRKYFIPKYTKNENGEEIINYTAYKPTENLYLDLDEVFIRLGEDVTDNIKQLFRPFVHLNGYIFKWFPIKTFINARELGNLKYYDYDSVIKFVFTEASTYNEFSTYKFIAGEEKYEFHGFHSYKIPKNLDFDEMKKDKTYIHKDKLEEKYDNLFSFYDSKKREIFEYDADEGDLIMRQQLLGPNPNNEFTDTHDNFTLI